MFSNLATWNGYVAWGGGFYWSRLCLELADKLFPEVGQELHPGKMDIVP
jgi:hypothetical protein